MTRAERLGRPQLVGAVEGVTYVVTGRIEGTPPRLVRQRQRFESRAEAEDYFSGLCPNCGHVLDSLADAECRHCRRERLALLNNDVDGLI